MTFPGSSLLCVTTISAMTRHHAAARADVVAEQGLPDLNDMAFDQLPPLDDPAVEPAVQALLYDVERPVSSVAGSQGS